MHSIAQELTMVRDCTLAEAEDAVQDMTARVAEGEGVNDVLDSEGLAHFGTWIAELNGDF